MLPAKLKLFKLFGFYLFFSSVRAGMRRVWAGGRLGSRCWWSTCAGRAVGRCRWYGGAAGAPPTTWPAPHRTKAATAVLTAARTSSARVLPRRWPPPPMGCRRLASSLSPRSPSGEWETPAEEEYAADSEQQEWRHDDRAAAAGGSGQRDPVVALVGLPNCGKSTLFNRSVTCALDYDA